VAVPDNDVVVTPDAPDAPDAPDEVELVELVTEDVAGVDVDVFDAVPDATVVVLDVAVDVVSACVRKLSTATTPTAVALRT
jgi:hypothetical protein